MTTLKKLISTVVAAAGLVAANVSLLTTSASAGERSWRHGGGFHAPYSSYRHGRTSHQPYHAPRRDRHGDAVGAAVLGIGALIIGAAIADAARHKRRNYD